MALTGLDIFKLTPKKNCKECGFPTCLAFAMKVATGAVEIGKCPHIGQEALDKLAEATAPPMKTIAFGTGANEYKLGGETVLYRHEKTFVNRNRFAAIISDDMSDQTVEDKINNIKKVDYIRIGEEMHVEVVAIKYAGNKERYIELINKLEASELKVAYMIVCEDVAVAKEAVEILKAKKPILFGATESNHAEIVEIAKTNKLVLGLKAESLESLYCLVEKVQKLGHKDLILDATGKTIKETFENAVQIRRMALKGGDRTFGYPSIVFANDLTKDKYMETALASMFTIKYGSIIVMDDMSYSKALPLYALRQNIFTDPQRPMTVEPKVYPINNPDENSPVLVTVDFALTYFIVSGEVERSKKPAWLVIPDAGGYSVLTAWAAGKFSGSIISNFIKESGIEQKTNSRKLLIPGKVAVLKGDIEDALPEWEVIVAPNEAMHLPKFLRELN